MSKIKGGNSVQDKTSLHTYKIKMNTIWGNVVQLGPHFKSKSKDWTKAEL